MSTSDADATDQQASAHIGIAAFFGWSSLYSVPFKLSLIQTGTWSEVLLLHFMVLLGAIWGVAVVAAAFRQPWASRWLPAPWILLLVAGSLTSVYQGVTAADPGWGDRLGWVCVSLMMLGTFSLPVVFWRRTPGLQEAIVSSRESLRSRVRSGAYTILCLWVPICCLKSPEYLGPGQSAWILLARVATMVGLIAIYLRLWAPRPVA